MNVMYIHVLHAIKMTEKNISGNPMGESSVAILNCNEVINF